MELMGKRLTSSRRTLWKAGQLDIRNRISIDFFLHRYRKSGVSERFDLHDNRRDQWQQLEMNRRESGHNLIACKLLISVFDLDDLFLGGLPHSAKV